MLAMLSLEWRRLCVRPYPWLLAAAVLAAMALELLLMLGPFLAGQQQLMASGTVYGYTEYVLLPWLALFVFAAVVLATLMSMGSLADERRHGTLALLFASGRSPTQIVLGKYLATLAWLLLVWLLVLGMPLALSLAGAPDWGKLAATALGLGLLLMTLSAIGVACSAHTRHPALAAAATLAIIALLFFVHRVGWHQGLLNELAHWLALPTHLQRMSVGLVDSADVVWFVIVTALALALAIHRLGQERERD